MPTEEFHEPVRLLAICGSLKKSSTTRKALQLAVAGAREAGASVSVADLALYELSFCTGDKAVESKGRDFPRLRQEMRAAHGLIVATPEYHGSFSGILKNALDLHDIDDLQDKVVGLIATAGGKQGGHSALNGLRTVFKALKAWTLPLDVSVPEAGKAFAEDGAPHDAALRQRLQELGKQVARFASLHSEKPLLPVSVRNIPELAPQNNGSVPR